MMRQSPKEYNPAIQCAVYVPLKDWEDVQDWKEEFVTTTSSVLRKAIHVGLKHKNDLFNEFEKEETERRERYGRKNDS